MVFLSWEFYGSACHTHTHTHTNKFRQLQLPVFLANVESTHIETECFLVPYDYLIIHGQLSPFHLISRDLMLVGDRSHKNLTPWQFYQPNISPSKISAFTVLGQPVCITLDFSLHSRSKATQHDHTCPQAFARDKAQCRCEVGEARLTWHEQRITHYINGKVLLLYSLEREEKLKCSELSPKRAKQ